MEDVYPRVAADRHARALSARPRREAASPTSRGTSTARSGTCCAPDHGRLLRNVVAWATNEPPPVEVDGPGVLDVTVWRQRDSMTVHLVNLTNPMMMKGPLREVIPVGPLTVRVRLPEGARAKKVQLLTAGSTVRAREAAGVLTITVPSVEIHEVVAIDT